MNELNPGKMDAQHESFALCGPLPRVTRDEITAMMQQAGATRIILAEFKVNQSDSMSDYWGCSIARTVAIGFGFGKRESFVQMRKAAGQFPPTSDYAPGKDIWKVRVIFSADVRGTGSPYWKGGFSHWHNDIGNGKTFETREQAESFIARMGPPADLHFHDAIGKFEWSIDHESFEHRENYSMGGGNYLGRCRYSGWTVHSTTYISDSVEFFTPAESRPQDKSRRRSSTSPAPQAEATECNVSELYSANV